MKLFSTLWLLCFGLSNAVGAELELGGTWHGSLQTPGGELRLQLELTGGAGQPWRATLESVDQTPGQSIPVSAVEVSGTQLTLRIGALGASWEGACDAVKQSCDGHWRQGAVLPLQWTRGPVPVAPVIAGLDGDWHGTLRRESKDFRLVLHVRSHARGTTATLDSPDMGATGMMVAGLARTGDRIRFDVPMAQVRYDAMLSAEGTQLEGQWLRQGQPEVRVRFVRWASGVAVRRRPQMPAAPLPYAVSEVQFTNPTAGITLAGTLSLPAGRGPFAAAVLISGSGPQDRDETVFGHKPFAVIADHLTRRGIAVLRFDDRGVGGSGGEFATATSADFAADVRAAVHFLAGQPRIDARAIGLIGHSEGGVVGPLAAVDNREVGFLVLLAAPATPVSEVLLEQRRALARMRGKPATVLADELAAVARLHAVVAASATQAEARDAVESVLTPAVLSALDIRPEAKDASIEEYSRDWMRELLRYRPEPVLKQLKVPVLALYGSLDQQVDCGRNLPAMRAALRGVPDATVRRLPGLNHMFQQARSGAMAEYGEIEQTVAPLALRQLSGWIRARFGARQRSA